MQRLLGVNSFVLVDTTLTVVSHIKDSNGDRKHKRVYSQTALVYKMSAHQMLWNCSYAYIIRILLTYP